MRKASAIIEQIKNARKDLEFLPTGLSKVDEALDGGFLRKELIILGGSTGIGKSYLSAQIAYNIATQGYKVGYFSLEISNEMIVARLLGQIANIKSTHIMTGKHNDEDAFEMARAELISQEPFMDFYDDVYEYGQLAKHIKEEKYDFIVIDFIQSIMMKDSKDEYQKLSFIALDLQRIAKENNCAIFVLSQLSNAYVKDFKQDMPRLEYKGSGSIAMVADLGFFVLRGDMELDPNKLYLILKKNRRGPSGFSFEFNFTNPGGLIQ